MNSESRVCGPVESWHAAVVAECVQLPIMEDVSDKLQDVQGTEDQESPGCGPFPAAALET